VWDGDHHLCQGCQVTICAVHSITNARAIVKNQQRSHFVDQHLTWPWWPIPEKPRNLVRWKLLETQMSSGQVISRKLWRNRCVMDSVRWGILELDRSFHQATETGSSVADIPWSCKHQHWYVMWTTCNDVPWIEKNMQNSTIRLATRMVPAKLLSALFLMQVGLETYSWNDVIVQGNLHQPGPALLEGRKKCRNDPRKNGRPWKTYRIPEKMNINDHEWPWMNIRMPLIGNCGNSQVIWWKHWDHIHHAWLSGSDGVMESLGESPRKHRRKRREFRIEWNSKLQTSKIIQFFIQNHLTESNKESYKGLKRFGSKMLSSLRSCTWDQTAVFNAVFNRRWRSALNTDPIHHESWWSVSREIWTSNSILPEIYWISGSKKGQFWWVRSTNEQMTQFPRKTNPSP